MAWDTIVDELETENAELKAEVESWRKAFYDREELRAGEIAALKAQLARAAELLRDAQFEIENFEMVGEAPDSVELWVSAARKFLAEFGEGKR